MIRMKVEGAFCGPRVFCDECGRQIENAANGVYLWKTRGLSKDPAEVFFACHYGSTKRRCHDVLEAKHDAHSWEHLDRFPLYLGNALFTGPERTMAALRRRWKKAQEMVLLMADA